ncbi:MAG: hypothetical protein ACJ780_01910, partial [Solirubrobacteraceae bacterium]
AFGEHLGPGLEGVGVAFSNPPELLDIHDQQRLASLGSAATVEPESPTRCREWRCRYPRDD